MYISSSQRLTFAIFIHDDIYERLAFSVCMHVGIPQCLAFAPFIHVDIYERLAFVHLYACL